MHNCKLKHSLLCFIPMMFSLTLCLSSCKTLETHKNGVKIDYKSLPKWTISINEIVKYPRASMGEKEVPAFSGRSIWVRKHHEFNSKAVISITPIPSKEKRGFFDLKLELNRHGSLVAMRLSNDVAHQQWAFLVDGVYYRTVVFNQAPLKPDYSEIIVKGPFDKSTAKFLQAYSEPNYEDFHPDE